MEGREYRGFPLDGDPETHERSIGLGSQKPSESARSALARKARKLRRVAGREEVKPARVSARCAIASVTMS